MANETRFAWPQRAWARSVWRVMSTMQQGTVIARDVLMARKRRPKSARASKVASPPSERETATPTRNEAVDEDSAGKREASRRLSTADVERDMTAPARDEDLEPGFPGNDWEARPADVD